MYINTTITLLLVKSLTEVAGIPPTPPTPPTPIHPPTTHYKLYRKIKLKKNTRNFSISYQSVLYVYGPGKTKIVTVKYTA